MEKATAVVGGGERVDLLVQGKKIIDEKKILSETGILMRAGLMSS